MNFLDRLLAPFLWVEIWNTRGPQPYCVGWSYEVNAVSGARRARWFGPAEKKTEPCATWLDGGEMPKRIPPTGGGAARRPIRDLPNTEELAKAIWRADGGSLAGWETSANVRGGYLEHANEVLSFLRGER